MLQHFSFSTKDRERGPAAWFVQEFHPRVRSAFWISFIPSRGRFFFLFFVRRSPFSFCFANIFLMILLSERAGSSRRGSPSFGVQDVLPLGFLSEIQSPVSLASSLAHSFLESTSSSGKMVVSISQTGIHPHVNFGVQDVLPLGFLSEIQSPVSLASSRGGRLSFS